MNFTEWLHINEGRWKGPVGGAFGRDKRRMNQPKPVVKPEPKPVEQPLHAPNPAERTPVPTTQPHARQDNRFQDYDARVQYGKSIEKQVFDSLVACGMPLREPSSREDMYDKIDGWWGDEPIQIKYRDTGDDILFEVMKDYNRRIPGRDMIGKAKYYAVLLRNGTIKVVSVEQAKTLIRQAVEEAENGGFDARGNFRTPELMLRIRPDPRSGQDKLMAYVSPRALQEVFKTCPAKVSF